MNLSIFQADAFTDELFRGNPAAVVPLTQWLPDKLMQNIAMENNLSETAFFIPGDGCFHMRWFTPTTEVSLCGHATLAAAHILFNHLDFSEETIRFQTKSGLLTVSRHENLLFLDFPAAHLISIPTPKGLTAGLGLRPLEVWHSGEYLMAVYKNENEIRQIIPDYPILRKLPYLGINVTAIGDSVDIVSRFFAPSVGINEDPVTGSAHTLMIPFWHQRLGRTRFISHQISKRGGILNCEYLDDRVKIGGKAVTFMVGSLRVEV
jgi:PhzF family phenazine biosynthesis protein